jgi:hypothetical protein
MLYPSFLRQMQLLCLFFVPIFVSFSLSAVNETPEGAIQKLFDGMRAGNGQAIRQLVLEGAQLDRVTKDGELRRGGFERWINWVDQQSAGDADEEIFAVRTQEFGGLATVWAPFILHYKGELAGCGVNQFTLARQETTWKIVHGIDTAYDGDCSEFKSLTRFK